MRNRYIVFTLAICLSAMMIMLASCAKEATEDNVAENDAPVSMAERIAALTPYVPPEQPERYYDGAVGEFIASDNYGRVYPYIGQVKSDLEPTGWEFSIKNFLYGFADEKGRIICDPVYESAELVTFKDKAAYILHYLVYPQGVTYVDYGIMSADTVIESYAAVVSADGSFFKKYEAARASEYIAVKQGDLWGVIDYDGTEILPCQYYNAPIFSEGLAAVYTNDPNDDSNDNKYEYVYIDHDGKQVLGPFGGFYNLAEASFSHGRAKSRVISESSLKPDHYGFIDKNGKMVVPQIYTSVSDYDENGLSIVSIREYGLKEYGVIDIDGNYIIPMRKGNFAAGGWGAFRRGEYYFFCFGDSNFADTMDVYNYMDGKTPIKTMSGNGINYFYNEYLGENIFLTETTFENIRTGELFYNFAAEWIKPYDIYYEVNVFHATDGSPCIIATKYDSESEKILHGVINQNGVVMEFQFDMLKRTGNYFCAVQGNYGGLLNPDGTWFVKVPLESIAD